LLTKTMPEVTGNITLSARVIVPERWHVVKNAYFDVDSSDPTGRTAKGVFAYEVSFSDEFTELPQSPPLKPFPSPLPTYRRCGDADCNHGDTPAPGHSKAFFGDPFFLIQVNAMINTYNAKIRYKFPGETEILFLSPMGLEWGGLFDTAQQWAQPLLFHRTGEAIDVSDRALRVKLTTFELREVSVNTGFLDFAAEKAELFRWKESANNHFAEFGQVQ